MARDCRPAIIMGLLCCFSCCFWIVLALTNINWNSVPGVDGHSIGVNKRGVGDSEAGYSCDPCTGNGARLTGLRGELTSPGYSHFHVHSYPPGLTCKWTLDVRPTRNTAFVFSMLYMDLNGTDNDQCTDQLVLKGRKNYGAWCKVGVKYMKVNEQKVTFTFTSDAASQGTGFIVTWDTVVKGAFAAVPRCKEIVDLTDAPHPFRTPEGHNVYCVLTMTAPVDMVVLFVIEELSMEAAPGSCHHAYDYLSFYDGQVVEEHRIVSRCGVLKAPSAVASTDRTMVLVYISDRSVMSRGVVGYFEAIAPIPVYYMPPAASLQERIVGGVLATEYEMQFLVSFHVDGEHRCGASLLSSRWIITAAHCVDDSPELASMQVVVGDYDRDTNGTYEKTYSIETIVKHESYLAGSVLNDLMLVKTSADISMGPGVRTICLPDYPVEIGETCRSAGWGSDQATNGLNTYMSKGDFTIRNNSQCADVTFSKTLPLSVICAGTQQRATCMGDSGGPLICPDKYKIGRWNQMGVVSAAAGCDGAIGEEKNVRTSAYTSLFHLNNWIFEHSRVFPPSRELEVAVPLTSDWAELDIDDCTNAPCENEGECIDHARGFTCLCVPGHEGRTCDINIDECASDPCQNGAACGDLLDGYDCQCTSGWNGTICDEDIDECASDPCQNGSTCDDLVDGYECQCASGWNGTICDEDIDECASDPCQNGATCDDLVNDYYCQCASGWTRRHCDKDIDECALDPCQNGAACGDLVDGYECQCTSGWTGTICDEDIDECALDPCQNGATCDDRVDDYYCQCASGWSAKNCDEDVNECASFPCQNGRCADEFEGYVCRCDNGWKGTNCDEDINDCVPSPCKNGAACLDLTNNFDCSCSAGWKGITCEEPYWYCGFDDQGICGMTQETTDDMEWTRISGNTPSDLTGPSSAAGGEGYYIHIDATTYSSNNYGVDQFGRFYTPGMQSGLVGSACVQFRYHMYGSAIDTLSMYTQIGDSTTRTIVWTLSDDQGDEWFAIQVDVNIIQNLRVGFEATLNSVEGDDLNYQADIAVDELYIYRGSC